MSVILSIICPFYEQCSKRNMPKKGVIGQGQMPGCGGFRLILSRILDQVPKMGAQFPQPMCIRYCKLRKGFIIPVAEAISARIAPPRAYNKASDHLQRIYRCLSFVFLFLHFFSLSSFFFLSFLLSVFVYSILHFKIIISLLFIYFLFFLPIFLFYFVTFLDCKRLLVFFTSGTHFDQRFTFP